jgi:hypothetical protein
MQPVLARVYRPLSHLLLSEHNLTFSEVMLKSLFFLKSVRSPVNRGILRSMFSFGLYENVHECCNPKR